MSHLSYPVQQTMPNVVNFEPFGGPNGDPCFKLDLQGSEPTAIAFRTPLIQESGWDVSLNMSLDTTDLAVSANGFEGVIPRVRLLQAGESTPNVLYDSLDLSVPDDEWYTVRTSWHQFSQSLSLPDVRPDVLDFWLVGKGPVGASFKVSNITLVNKYSKTFEINVPGVGLNIEMTRKFETVRVAGGLDGISYIRSFQDAYLDTVPCQVLKGDRVKCKFAGILSFSRADPFIEGQIIKYEVAVKFRSPEGNETWSRVVYRETPEPNVFNAVLTGTDEFVAEHNYNQMNLVISVETTLDDTQFFASRNGMNLEVVSSRPLSQ